MFERVIIEFCASVLIWTMYVGIFLLWFIDGKIKKEQALHALFASGLAWLVANIIKDTVFTQRPFMVNNLPTFVFFTPYDSAFPSGHSATAFAIAVTIWLHNKKWGIIYLLIALVIGIARVVGNVHYPIDIVGGALIGSMVALAIEKVHLFDFLNAVSKKHK